MRYCIFILLFFILLSCSSSPVPKEILTPDKMTAATKDIIKVDEYINTYLMSDSGVDIKIKRSNLYNKVFALHNTTKEQFYKSFYYYRQHPDLMKSLFDSLTFALKKQEYKKADTSAMHNKNVVQ